MKLKDNVYPALIPLSGCALAAALFFVGIGRYTTILLISCVYFVESIFVYKKADTTSCKAILGPLVIVTLFIDFKYGQLWPLYPSNNVLIALLIFVIAELYLKKATIAFIEKNSNYSYFGCCPSCLYANKNLTDRCSNCGFETTGLVPETVSKGSSRTKQVRSQYKCRNDLASEVPHKCLQLLNLDADEECIGSLRIYPERGVYVNGSKTLVKYLIITNFNVILLDYHFYYNGWTYRKLINIGNIKSITIERKFHHNKLVPILSLEAEEETYEFFYSPFASAFERLEGIARCIKNLNIAIEVKSERIAKQ